MADDNAPSEPVILRYLAQSARTEGSACNEMYRKITDERRYEMETFRRRPDIDDDELSRI
jgi:hypothetical protein